MTPPFVQTLSSWQAFYTFTGGAAATLIGLLFVVVSLGVDVPAAHPREDVSLFLTPGIVHFGAVLLVAALCLSPIHQSGILGILLLLVGLAGLTDTGLTVVRRLRSSRSQPLGFNALVWRLGWPALSFSALSVSGLIVALTSSPIGLSVVAVVTMALLVLGIRNAWAVVIELARRRQSRDSRQSDSPS
jgi:hypothetical protein